MSRPTTRAAAVLAAVAIGVGGCAGQGGTTASPTTSAGGSAGAPSSGSSAAAFNWKAFSGTEITFLANQHPWTDGMTPLLDTFTQETGIKVNVQPFSEDLY